MGKRLLIQFTFTALLLTGALVAGVSQQPSTRIAHRDDIVYKTVTRKLEILDVDLYAESLAMDIYFPKDSAGYKRPLLVWVHGGGFAKGSKKDESIRQLCGYFARKGFVTAAVNYRLFAPGENINIYRLMYKAMQDVTDAVYYLHSRADSLRISPAYTFIGGISAGAITALNTVFWQQDEQLIDIDLKGLYGPLPSILPFRGAVSISGALPETSLLSHGNKCPVISFHGVLDDTVKIGKGVPSFNWNNIDLVAVYNELVRRARGSLDAMESEMNLMEVLGKEMLGLDKADIPPLFGPDRFHETLQSLGIKNRQHRYEALGHTLCMEEGRFLPTFDSIATNTSAFFSEISTPAPVTTLGGYAKMQQAGDTCTYKVPLTEEGLSAKWLIEKGLLLSSDHQSATVLWDSTGTGKITVWLENEIGNKSAPATFHVQVTQKSLIQASISLSNALLIVSLMAVGLVAILIPVRYK